jgi:hypothetical protein
VLEFSGNDEEIRVLQCCKPDFVLRGARAIKIISSCSVDGALLKRQTKNDVFE